MQDYHKYRWFFTSSGKLVVGGKSSEQNDILLNSLQKEKQERVVMHTAAPGSPFSVIVSSVKEITDTDMEEAAVFTGCFSQQWKAKKKTAQIDVFLLSQLFKSKSMKAGTWGVKNKMKSIKVLLQLALTIQEGKLRAVPENTVKKKDILLTIRPGKIDKVEMLPKFTVLLKKHVSKDELLSALPAGGVSIVK